VLCSPVFLNMTRWGLAYGEARAAWTDAVVDRYVATIEAGLGAAVATRRRAGPRSTELLYMPAAAAGACLNQILFNRAVGSAQGDAGCNGQTRLEELRCVLQAAGPPPTLPATANPYFAIIDSNAAHHVSLLLAERAFAAVPAGFAKAIVNFDAHEDFGTQVTPRSFRCDNWGIFSVRAVAGVYANPLANAYACFANKGAGGAAPNPPFSNSFVCRRPPAPVGRLPLAGATVAEQTTALLGLLGAGAPPGIAVYVTVDRDSMQSSYTDYDDGPYTQAALHAAAQECLQTLRAAGVTLAGFDVCGLPTLNGRGAQRLTPAERQAQALADLQFFHQQVLAY
jgi:hypothetical protein